MREINLRFTVRDIELMKDINDHQFLSFYQIHEKHFPENKKPTVYNRLSKLIKAEGGGGRGLDSFTAATDCESKYPFPEDLTNLTL